MVECQEAWSSSQANIVRTCLEKMRTTTRGPSVVLNGVCVACRWSLSRQQTKRTVAINKALFGGQGESEPSRHRSMHHLVLHGPRSEYHFLREIFDEMPTCPMLVSSLENRKQHETGPTRYRDWWERLWREALEELMLQWCGETDTVDEASRDDMGGLFGQRYVILSSETRSCVR